MKTALKIISLLLFVILLTSCANSNTAMLTSSTKTDESKAVSSSVKTDESKVIDFSEKKYTYIKNLPTKYENCMPTVSVGDYKHVAESLQRLYDDVDIVMEVEVLTKKSYIESQGIYSEITVDVLETYKGEYDKRYPICVAAGTVPYSEYTSAVSQVEKLFIPEEERKNPPDFISSSADGVCEPEVGDRFIVFSIFNEYTSHYIIQNNFQGLFKVNGDFFEDMAVTYNLSGLAEDIVEKSAEEGSIAIKDYGILEKASQKEVLVDGKLKRIQKELTIDKDQLIPLKETRMDKSYLEKGISVDGFRKAIENLAE
jgi:hypothetical protein